jgi:hypothetical protein
MKLEPETAVTSITFRADEATRAVLHAHQDVVKAIWEACFPLIDAKIEVFMNPRLRDSESMEWSMTISSPLGRRSIAVTQRVPLGVISFKEA